MAKWTPVVVTLTAHIPDGMMPEVVGKDRHYQRVIEIDPRVMDGTGKGTILRAELDIAVEALYKQFGIEDYG